MRLGAVSQLRSLERRRREEERRYTKAERREHRRLARASRRAAPVPVPPVPASEVKLRRSFRRLGRVIELSPRTIQRRVIEGIAEAPYSNVTVKVDVPRSSFNFLKERKDEFPGVDVEKLFLRAYPHKELAAQLFGTLREISPEGAEEEEVPRRRGRHAHRRRRHRAGVRPLPARPGRLHAVVINALGNRDVLPRTTGRGGYSRLAESLDGVVPEDLPHQVGVHLLPAQRQIDGLGEAASRGGGSPC